MPLSPADEQPLRQLYEPADLDEALRRAPRELELLWEELGRQLREDAERRRR